MIRRPPVMKNPLLLLLFLTFVSAHSLGQTPVPKSTPAQADDDVIRVKTSLVQLDAVVVDQKGRQVTDLTANDFEVLEEGQKKTIDHFSYVTVEVPKAAVNNNSEHPERPARVFVFAISNPIIELGYSFPSRASGVITAGTVRTNARAVRAADSARSLLQWFVDSQMNDNDLVAIADLDVNLGVLASFTNDREVLNEAIATLRKNATNGSSPTIRIMAVGTEFSLQPLVQYNLSILDTLETVIGQLQTLPGRKVLTLVSRGLLYNPTLPYADVIKQRRARLIEKANRAQIAIYTVQTRDLSPAGGNSGNDGLIDLANETGGRAIYNKNDLRVGFNEIIEENRGYYLLAYNPGPDADGRPRRLTIRVNRPGVKVLSRLEAFSRPAATATKALLDSPLTSRDIRMELKPLINEKSRVQFSWHIDLTGVETEKVSGNDEGFSLALFARVTGPDGEILKRAEKNSDFTVKGSELEAARQKGVDSRFEFAALKAGYYRIEVAVRDLISGKTGRLTRFVKVAK
jgi:VWFA-related protein